MRRVVTVGRWSALADGGWSAAARRCSTPSGVGCRSEERARAPESGLAGRRAERACARARRDRSSVDGRRRERRSSGGCRKRWRCGRMSAGGGGTSRARVTAARSRAARYRTLPVVVQSCRATRRRVGRAFCLDWAGSMSESACRSEVVGEQPENVDRRRRARHRLGSVERMSKSKSKERSVRRERRSRAQDGESEHRRRRTEKAVEQWGHVCASRESERARENGRG